ncbi:MAG: sigma-70 family RNA polymerase sigma factor [Candidatus Krumholzibacteriales bacterium]
MNDINKPIPDGKKKAGKTDEELILAVQEGDNRAFDILVERYKNRLFAYLLRMLSDRDKAEEIAQETFVRAYMNADKYRTIARFSTWLYTIGTNLVRNHIRKMKRRPSTWSLWSETRGEDGDWMEIEDSTQDAEQLADRSDLQELIDGAIQKIPPKYRSAFVLRELEQLSYDEIAATTGIKLGTVRSRINRGRKYFKDAIAPYLKDDNRFKETPQ